MARRLIHDRPIPWVSDTIIDFSGVRVELCGPPALYERQSTENHFIIGKSASMIEGIMAITETIDTRIIVDVGVYKGGSVVFLNEAFHPDKLLAIDCNLAAPAALAHYCKDPTRANRPRIFLGVDQADQGTLGTICRSELGTAPLDLVIDDASHFLEQSRATFRALFPRLRPGGIYVIEDWAWAHWPEDHWQKERGGDYFRGRLPLSNLLVELMLLSAGSPHLVSRVTVNSAVIYVERGPAELDPGFELSEHYFNRGDPVPKIGAAGTPSAIYLSPEFVFRV